MFWSLQKWNSFRIKRVKYKDLEDMVYRLQLTYDELVNVLDVKITAGSNIRYTLSPVLYEITDINLMLKSLLPDKLKWIIQLMILD